MIQLHTSSGVVSVSETDPHKLVCERRAQWINGAWRKVDVAR